MASLHLDHNTLLLPLLLLQGSGLPPGRGGPGGSIFLGGGQIGACAVDDDADAHFVDDNMADESTIGIETRLGVWEWPIAGPGGPGQGSDVARRDIFSS